MKSQMAFFLTLSLVSTGCLKTLSELSEPETKKAAQTQVQTLQQQKADADAQILSLEANIRNQNGRIETLEHQLEQSSRTREEQIQRINTLETRVKALEEGILQLNQDFESAKATPPPAPAQDKGPFEEGEDLFLAKEWKKAIASYQKYREANPKGEHFSTATYKIGVALQELKMFKEARVFFDEVIERYPKSKAARSATYRLNQIKKKAP